MQNQGVDIVPWTSRHCLCGVPQHRSSEQPRLPSCRIFLSLFLVLGVKCVEKNRKRHWRSRNSHIPGPSRFLIKTGSIAPKILVGDLAASQLRKPPRSFPHVALSGPDTPTGSSSRLPKKGKRANYWGTSRRENSAGFSRSPQMVAG